MTAVHSGGAAAPNINIGSEPEIRVVSLFSGLGGADRGLYEAAKQRGYKVRVVAAYDSWEKSVAVYNSNPRDLPHRVGQVGDVKQIQVDDLPPHDLVVGGPPCQSFSMAGKKTGFEDERNCVPDFIRLTRGGTTPFVMENVRGGLLSHYGIQSYCVDLQAFDYGDATSRTRYFYTNIGPFIVDNDQPRFFSSPNDIVVEKSAVRRTFKDIRETEADARHIEKVRRRLDGEEDPNADLPLLVGVGFRSNDGVGAKLVGPDDVLGSLTSCSHHNIHSDSLKEIAIAMRGFQGVIRYIGDDQPLDGLTGNVATALSWGHLGATARCPSILEMQRSHSLPDDMEWAGNNALGDRGKMIANAWPVGMATAIMGGVLDALVRLRIKG